MKTFYMIGFLLLTVLWLIIVFQNLLQMPTMYSILTLQINGNPTGLIIFTSIITIPMGATLTLWLKSPNEEEN